MGQRDVTGKKGTSDAVCLFCLYPKAESGILYIVNKCERAVRYRQMGVKMAEVRPFRAWRPAQGLAERIAALPYDVVNGKEAREETRREPFSFLAVDRPETQFEEEDADVTEERDAFTAMDEGGKPSAGGGALLLYLRAGKTRACPDRNRRVRVGGRLSERCDPQA